MSWWDKAKPGDHVVATSNATGYDSNCHLIKLVRGTVYTFVEAFELRGDIGIQLEEFDAIGGWHASKLQPVAPLPASITNMLKAPTGPRDYLPRELTQ